MTDRDQRQHFFANCPPPPVKPIDRCERGQYETGKANFDTPDSPTQAWESSSIANSDANSTVLPMPGSLMFLHATFSTAVVVPVYVLLYDMDPTTVQQFPGPGAIARYTLGPCVPIPTVADPTVSSGGTVTYEATAEEVYNAPGGPDRRARSIGLPFNFGIVAVASFGPRVYTLSELATMEWALTARFQT